MKFHNVWTIVYAIAICTLGFNLLTEELKAQSSNTQAQDNFDLEIDDQARYLAALENRSASQWSFATKDRTENLENYQLTSPQSEIRFTQYQASEWNNTGDAGNYSVLLDVYEFTAETDD